MKLRVWAPSANAISVKIADQRLPMARAANGYWELDDPQAAAGSDYSFTLDGGNPLPDPRSPSQPNGVHGTSRLVDHSLFSWSDQGWSPPPLSSAIIYELHIGTFTAAGTFEAAIERLDHLVDLGVTHIELMPVAQFPGNRGWGYDGADIFAPHHAYGGPDGLKRLADASHRRGLAMLLDVVYNHFGPDGNYVPQFGPYLTNRYVTPWGSAINFDDRGSDEVRRFFCENALMWLREYHFDGLRLDAIHAIVDTSATHLLEQLASEAAALERELERKLVLIAESDLNDPRIVRPTGLGGYGIDAQWSDDFHHALHSVLTRETTGYYADFGSLGDLCKALQQGFVYDGCYSRFRGRRHGRSAAGLSGHNFLGYLQNHDQVGNRAKGDRSSQLMSEGRLRIAAALILTSPFIPMLFHGEEWGATTPFLYFTGHEDEKLGHAVSEGRKREFVAFGWSPDDIPDPQAVESFTRSKLDWTELQREPHQSLWQWHRDLIRLRKRNPDLTDGRLDNVQTACHESERWLTVRRGSVCVACNLAGYTQRVGLKLAPHAKFAMASDPNIRLEQDHIELPPDSVGIIVN